MPGGAHCKAPAGGEVITAVVFGKYADDRRDPRMRQGLFERPEHIDRLGRDDMDQPVGIDAEGGKANGIEAANARGEEGGQHPKHMP